MNKITKFTDLNCWKEAHKLVLMIYQITEKFPSKEQFGLTNQIRRAGVSITSNIAEGFSRSTLKDKIHFYYISQGSVSEVQSQLIIAKDIKYIVEIDYTKIYKQSIIVHKLISGSIKSLKKSPLIVLYYPYYILRTT